MASKTLCVSSQKGKELCGESKVHNRIDNSECKGRFSCLSECHAKLASGGINDTSCHGGNHLEPELIFADSGGPCSSKLTQEDLSETIADNVKHALTTAVDDGACLHGNHGSCVACSGVQSEQSLWQQTGSTLQDLYTQEYLDDEDDNDSDWEPVNHVVIKKWFCANCTVPNFEDVFRCYGCGEHKDSETSRYDFPQTRSSIGSGAVDSYKDPSSRKGTAIGFDERMLLHSEVEMKKHPHPERPDRLRAIAATLATNGLFPGKCSLIPAREITREELEMVHSVDHISAVQQTSRMFSSYFTPDTYANEHSACAARIAAGLCADLALTIMSGHSLNGFALVRPPGHHAGVKQAMGFCLHNNAAVAALAAQRAGAKKVLIVDWDVHHGNGTQEIFDGNKSVLYISLHRHEDGRFYPGTGAANEVGINGAEGYSVNIPWNCGGIGDNDYIFAFQHIVLPIASEFDPDITIVSSGFDAARGDPLGCCDVTPAGYAQMTHMLSALSQGKLLVILEGGYNLISISSSATAVVKVLLGENPCYEMDNLVPSYAGLQAAVKVMSIQLEFWPILKSSYISLQTQWKWLLSIRRKEAKKRKRLVGPIWWKWGSKKFIYEMLYARPHRRGWKHAK